MGDCFYCSKAEPVVQTKAGKIRGFKMNSTYTFHGIKYADADRFQMPREVKPWKGIKNALAYGYVCPMLIPNDHPLATVNDSYNAVFVHGDAVEDAMFFGRGAGELPTASAVVGDIFDIVRNMEAGCCGRIGCTCYKQLPVKKMEDTYNRYFLRLHVEDRCGVLAEMTEVFAKYHVSIAQIIQKDSQNQDDHLAEVVVITSKVREGDFKTAVQELSNKSSVKRISKTIRVYRK